MVHDGFPLVDELEEVKVLVDQSFSALGPGLIVIYLAFVRALFSSSSS